MTALPVEPQTMADVERAREAHRRLWAAADHTSLLKLAVQQIDEAPIQEDPAPDLVAPDDDAPLQNAIPRVTIERIAREVERFYGVARADLVSVRRRAKFVRARHVVMYLARTMTTRSMPDIGARMGRRDHTTIMHGVRKIEGLIEVDAKVAADIETLRARILGGVTP